MKNLQRQKASILARQILTKKISYEYFVDEYPNDTGDYEIESLFDLIEHQPKVGGLFGVKQSTFNDYNLRIIKLIEQLEN